MRSRMNLLLQMMPLLMPVFQWNQSLKPEGDLLVSLEVHFSLWSSFAQEMDMGFVWEYQSKNWMDFLLLWVDFWRWSSFAQEMDMKFVWVSQWKSRMGFLVEVEFRLLLVTGVGFV